MRPPRLLLTLAVAVATGSVALAQPQEDVALGGLPPVERTYKGQIVAWAGRTFADARALTAARISEPTLIRDGTGRLLWLVCVETVNGAPTARSSAPERFAFGFAPGYFSAPLQRAGATLGRVDCEERPLAWRPFRELGGPGEIGSVPPGDRRGVRR